VRIRLLLIGLAAMGAVFASVRGAVRPADPHPGPSAPEPVAPSPAAREAGSSVDLGAVRDVFRYADEGPRPTTAGGLSAARRAPGPAGEAAAPPRVRLVGIVWRGGTALAALAIDGELVLLAAGESASGHAVLAVGADAVRLRRPDGSEETLALP